MYNMVSLYLYYRIDFLGFNIVFRFQDLSLNPLIEVCHYKEHKISRVWNGTVTINN